jgi:hypothetical protein
MTRKIWQLYNHKLCPYCGGELVRSKTGLYHFDCTECDRCWKVDEHGTWHAMFDAGRTTYTKEELAI